MAIDTPSPSPSASSAAAGRQTRAAESVRLEHQLLRVPLEALKSTVRTNHRLAEKEIAAVLSSAAAAPGGGGGGSGDAAAVDHLTSLVSRLHGLKRKVVLPSPSLPQFPTSLRPPISLSPNPHLPSKRSWLVDRLILYSIWILLRLGKSHFVADGLIDYDDDDDDDVLQMEEGARAEELQVQRCRARLNRLASASSGDDAEWEELRLKRILVDYMLRMSYYDTAANLAETSGIQV